MTDDELGRRLGEAMRPSPAHPPADRVAALRERAEQARRRRLEREPDPAAPDAAAPDAAAPDPAAPAVLSRHRRARLLLALAAGVVLLVAAATLGALVSTGGPDGSEQGLLARAVPEFAARLSQDEVEVDVEGARAPEGRVVVLRSDSLPVLPVGEYYELWFVGPDDSPSTPDRVSAGTFHPDYDDGRTAVVLHAAVDPELFPVLEITAEAGDGDPGPSEDVVLRGPVDLLG